MSTAAAIPFLKMEGLGNDFLVVHVASEEDARPLAEAAARLCDRHFGVGGDGILFVYPSHDPAYAGRMRVVNADGSIPEMCGNGLRCVALALAMARGIERGTLVVETDAGPRTCAIERDGDRASVRIDMGEVGVLAEVAIPLADGEHRFLLADAGNPHAITFTRYARAAIDAVGPAVATHAYFPRGTNVEFARVVPGEGIDLFVWERGVGPTLACGTGACATAAAACARGLAPYGEPLRVTLPGGPLVVTVDPPDPGSIAGNIKTRVTMEGPARLVFRGVLSASF